MKNDLISFFKERINSVDGMFNRSLGGGGRLCHLTQEKE